jgi:hypothetical protein
MDGFRGALWLPLNYLRRDATALGLILLSIIDITSSFHKDGGSICLPPKNDQSMAHFKVNVNRLASALIEL